MNHRLIFSSCLQSYLNICEAVLTARAGPFSWHCGGLQEVIWRTLVDLIDCGFRQTRGALAVNSESLAAWQSLDFWIGFSRQTWTYQSLHVVDTARDVSDVVVTEVELPQFGQTGERGRQRGQLVVSQTQHLRDRNTSPFHTNCSAQV